ncbi:MAG: hypothetical protein ACRC4W_06260 [Treponemataceae bacterium]
MNTIPSIFNQRKIPQIILGAGESNPHGVDVPISILLLNRGAKNYRSKVLENLISFGFHSILSIETSQDNYDIDTLIRSYPSVKFLVPKESVTIGDMINMGMAELESEYVFVIWNDVSLSGKQLPPKLFDYMFEKKLLCIAPLLSNGKMQNFPTEMIPTVEKGLLKINSKICFFDDVKTLYPFDFMGIYNRQKFIQLGGFDYTIKSSYWQCLDFFFRGFLWGEQTKISTFLRLSYEEDINPEERTPDESYLRFYLKNLATQFDSDHAFTPYKKIFSYIHTSPRGIFESIKDFRNAKRWIEMNKYRFVQDAKMLITSWDNEAQ